MITLLQRSGTQPLPNVMPVNSPSHLQRNRQVTTLNSKIEPSLLILHKVESDLGVSLLLKITNDTLTNKIAISNDMQDFIIVLAVESKLESVLSRVNVNSLRLGGTVETVNDRTLDSSEVHRLFKSFDDPVITLRKSVLDVVQSGVYEHTAVVPSGRLDSNRLVDESALRKRLVGNGDCVLAQEGDHVTIGAPYNILNGRGIDFGNNLLLLNVEKDYRRRSGEQNGRRTAVKYLGRLDRALDSLGDRVGKILNFDVLGTLVEDCEPVPCHEERTEPCTLLTV